MPDEDPVTIATLSWRRPGILGKIGSKLFVSIGWPLRYTRGLAGLDNAGELD